MSRYIKKRCRCETKANQKEKRYACESVKIPAWLRAENGLRLANWNNTKLRKILKSCYIVPDNNNELTCYHLADFKSPYFVRVVCSNFNPHKIIIGTRGLNNKKSEFAPSHLDLLILALTSLLKGSKSKTINLGSRGEKLKMEITNAHLNFTHSYPSDIKKIIQKNNMASYLAPEDCQFNIPISEIDNFMETLLDGVQFIRLQRDIIAQRKSVFEVSVHQLKQAAALRQNQCLSMSTLQFSINLFEIYYSMNSPPTENTHFLLCCPNIIKCFLMHYK